MLTQIKSIARLYVNKNMRYILEMTKKKKIGRPKMAAHELKSKLIAFRVDNSKFNLIRKAAEQHDVSMGMFCEEAALQCAERALR